MQVHRALYGFMALVEQAVAGRPNELLDQLAAVGQGHFDAAPPATSLHAAVEAGNAGTLRALIGWGADPNAADRNGSTALHLAVALGKVGRCYLTPIETREVRARAGKVTPSFTS